MLPTKKRSIARAEFLADLLTTAVEGGINYWSAVEDYRWYDNKLTGGTAEHRDGEPNAYVTIHANGDSRGDFNPRTIGVEDIARALRLVREDNFPKGEGCAYYRDDILEADRENDAGITDAGAADCLVQIAMFGKVIYG